MEKACAIFPLAETIKKEMEQFQKRFRVNEFMITSHIYEHEARLKSYEIILNLAAWQIMRFIESP